VVVVVEWAALHDEPHYGSGLPPRYYVPRVNLPPAQPLEQVELGYPEAHRDEAPTWIAPADLRAEMLGEWPVLAPEQAEQEPEPVLAPDPWTVVELPQAPLDEVEPQPERQFDAVLVRTPQRLARHSLDPLGDSPPRRRFGRGGSPEPRVVEVPARIEGVRALPGTSTGEE
jgi:hypothetical protein